MRSSIFGNHIDGVLDAPVYDVDGVTKLQGEHYFASLWAGSSASSMAPVGGPARFQTGTNAGYWLPQQVTLPGATAGQRIYVQVRIIEPVFGTEFQSVAWGSSKVFSVVLQDSPTPLVGLELFRLGLEYFRVERQGSDFIIRWRDQANVTYSLETTTDLTDARSWNVLWQGTGVYPADGTISVTNAIAGEQRFFRLKLWQPP
ncbi:MAG TPA: hypothetical protein VJW76_09875 [Verrucomicrobiae bacterium]|nr:hypothetical protein [Verrucomicrobiae bacterium]